MGHRQLALTIGAITGLIGLLIAAIRMIFDFYDGISIIITAVFFIASSIVVIMIGKKKWELDYKNALVLLYSTSIICALVYSFGYGYVQDAFLLSVGKVDIYSFGALLAFNLAFKLPIDLVCAIFYKR